MITKEKNTAAIDDDDDDDDKRLASYIYEYSMVPNNEYEWLIRINKLIQYELCYTCTK